MGPVRHSARDRARVRSHPPDPPSTSTHTGTRSRSTMARSQNLRLAVALDGAGWHPAAWREDGARPADLFSPDYWVDLVRESERGLLDFVSIEDSLATDPVRWGVAGARTDQVRGRLDAVMVAARVAPTCPSIGVVPVATTTHTEPF